MWNNFTPANLIKIDKFMTDLAVKDQYDPETVEEMAACNYSKVQVLGGDNKMMDVFMITSKNAPKKNKTPVISLTYGGAALFGHAWD